LIRFDSIFIRFPSNRIEYKSFLPNENRFPISSLINAVAQSAGSVEPANALFGPFGPICARSAGRKMGICADEKSAVARSFQRDHARLHMSKLFQYFAKKPLKCNVAIRILIGWWGFFQKCIEIREKINLIKIPSRCRSTYEPCGAVVKSFPSKLIIAIDSGSSPDAVLNI